MMPNKTTTKNPPNYKLIQLSDVLRAQISPVLHGLPAERIELVSNVQDNIELQFRSLVCTCLMDRLA